MAALTHQLISKKAITLRRTRDVKSCVTGRSRGHYSGNSHTLLFNDAIASRRQDVSKAMGARLNNGRMRSRWVGGVVVASSSELDLSDTSEKSTGINEETEGIEGEELSVDEKLKAIGFVKCEFDEEERAELDKQAREKLGFGYAEFRDVIKLACTQT